MLLFQLDIDTPDRRPSPASREAINRPPRFPGEYVLHQQKV